MIQSVMTVSRERVTSQIVNNSSIMMCTPNYWAARSEAAKRNTRKLCLSSDKPVITPSVDVLAVSMTLTTHQMPVKVL
jgi:hypothetical protein